MIAHGTFGADPWILREENLDLDALAATESIFALSNGHLGLRGNFEEGEPVGAPGTYLNGFYEERPLPYAEAGYGYPESGQTLVNITDGKLIRLTVDDELFDVRYGHLHRHKRSLDFRTGLLTREVEWESPIGSAVRIKTQRLVSFAQRNIAAILYEVTPLNDSARLVVQSELVANEPEPERKGDPRAAAALKAPLETNMAVAFDNTALLAHTTHTSKLHMAVAMGHLVDGPENTTRESHAYNDIARLAIAATVEGGETLRMVKLLSYGWSGHRSSDSVRAQVQGALAEGHHTGWDGLVKSQRDYLDDFWSRSDVEIDGDAELQQAVRFSLFHVLQAGARGEGRAIPAKGLTGAGYDGHAFWDSESFVMRALTYMEPEAVRDALTWRHATLDLARDRAGTLGLKGAAFPWRTIHGEECSAYWPAGTAGFHVNADIADAVQRYYNATENGSFMLEQGLEILAETARLWLSLGYRGPHGHFRIDGVTGPDEYSALGDNNVYTNLMAARNMAAAADAAEAMPERAFDLGIKSDEIEAWREASEVIEVPYDEELGVHPQADRFTRYERWNFKSTPAECYPLMLHYPYFELYRRQVIKQADLVLALWACGDKFTPKEKQRDFDYYEALTVRDSSLSAAPQAIVAAETGHLQLAYDYFAEVALVDLNDLARNSRDGLHVASLAGTWLCVVAGFGGFRDHGGNLSFAPQLPPALSRIKFHLNFRGRRLEVEVEDGAATYTLQDGDGLEFTHHGDETRVEAGKPVVLELPEVPEREPPEQPPGRAPEPRNP